MEIRLNLKIAGGIFGIRNVGAVRPVDLFIKDTQSFEKFRNLSLSISHHPSLRKFAGGDAGVPGSRRIYSRTGLLHALKNAEWNA